MHQRYQSRPFGDSRSACSAAASAGAPTVAAMSAFLFAVVKVLLVAVEEETLLVRHPFQCLDEVWFSQQLLESGRVEAGAVGTFNDDGRWFYGHS